MQGVAGRLVSAAFIRDLLSTLDGYAPPPAATGIALDRWRQQVDLSLGPASSPRAVADVAVLPLLTLLELDVTTRTDDSAVIRIATTCASCRGPDVLVVGWDQPLSPTWRDAVTASRRAECRWAICTNGTTLRVVDAVRTWSRDYLELDLAMAGTDPQVQRLLWTFIRGPAVTSLPSALARAADLSAEYGTDICRALGRSVLRGLSSLLSHLATCHATSRLPAGKRRRTRVAADARPASIAAPPSYA